MVYYLPTDQDLLSKLHHFQNSDTLRSNFVYKVEPTDKHRCIYKFTVSPKQNFYETIIREMQEGII